jgi:hypothetical protein
MDTYDTISIISQFVIEDTTLNGLQGWLIFLALSKVHRKCITYTILNKYNQELDYYSSMLITIHPKCRVRTILRKFFLKHNYRYYIPWTYPVQNRQLNKNNRRCTCKTHKKKMCKRRLKPGEIQCWQHKTYTVISE